MDEEMASPPAIEEITMVKDDMSPTMESPVEKLSAEDEKKPQAQTPGRSSTSELTGPAWEDDPDNAQNWALRKKVYHSAVPALMSVVT
jgi:hypothetical protein